MYFFYYWEIFNFYRKSLIRFTGSEINLRTAVGFDGGNHDYPEQAQHSQLLSYIVYKINRELIMCIEDAKSSINSIAKDLPSEAEDNICNFIKNIQNAIEKITKNLFSENENIVSRLLRFENFFKKHKKSQISLFFIKNIIFPFILCILSGYFIFMILKTY